MHNTRNRLKPGFKKNRLDITPIRILKRRAFQPPSRCISSSMSSQRVESGGEQLQCRTFPTDDDDGGPRLARSLARTDGAKTHLINFSQISSSAANGDTTPTFTSLSVGGAGRAKVISFAICIRAGLKSQKNDQSQWFLRIALESESLIVLIKGIFACGAASRRPTSHFSSPVKLKNSKNWLTTWKTGSIQSWTAHEVTVN